MTDLASWLLAQIADDEAAARAAGETVGEQEWVGSHDLHPWRYEASGVYGYNDGIASHAPLAAECSEPTQSHIARHDPARVLAECAAKRAIVELYQARLANSKVHKGDLALAGSVLTLLNVVKLLAQPYADREGFDPAWRVDA